MSIPTSRTIATTIASGTAFGLGANGTSGILGYATNAKTPPAFTGTVTNGSGDRSNITVGGGDVITITGADGEEVVKVRRDGRVVWQHGTQIDAAAKAFSTMLRLGIAECAGVTGAVRAEIRNQVYTDLIALAKEKGNLSIEDLTFDRDSCILVEKLANPTKE